MLYHKQALELLKQIPKVTIEIASCWKFGKSNALAKLVKEITYFKGNSITITVKCRLAMASTLLLAFKIKESQEILAIVEEEE